MVYKESESEVAQSSPTLCNPMDYSLLGSSLPPWDSPDKSTGVGCHFLLQGSLPGSSLYGILQAKVLEWVAIFFSRGSSQPRNQTQVSCILGRCFNL